MYLWRAARVDSGRAPGQHMLRAAQSAQASGRTQLEESQRRERRGNAGERMRARRHGRKALVAVRPSHSLSLSMHR